MKGIRFYVELDGLPKRTTRKQLRERAERGQITNVVAVLLGREHQFHNSRELNQEAFVSTFAAAGSDVSLGAVSREYLRGCRHIDELTARKLHPQLFRRLDD